MKNKIKLVLFILLVSTIGANAQFITKISIGIKGGANFHVPNQINRNSVFEAANTESNLFDKEYEPFYNNVNHQFVFVGYYKLTEKSYISFQPGISCNSINYSNTYQWQGESNTFDSEYVFKHNLQFINLPVLYKYEFLNRRLQPYIQLGVYYDFLANSTSNITKTETTEFGALEYNKESLGANDFYIQSSVGSIGGIGVTYRFKRSKLGIESNFKYGFFNIADTQNRFNNSQITGKYYDTPDDFRIMNASISAIYTVSMECISKTTPPNHREF